MGVRLDNGVMKGARSRGVGGRSVSPAGQGVASSDEGNAGGGTAAGRTRPISVQRGLVGHLKSGFNLFIIVLSNSPEPVGMPPRCSSLGRVAAVKRSASVIVTCCG